MAGDCAAGNDDDPRRRACRDIEIIQHTVAEVLGGGAEGVVAGRQSSNREISIRVSSCAVTAARSGSKDIRIRHRRARIGHDDAADRHSGRELRIEPRVMAGKRNRFVDAQISLMCKRECLLTRLDGFDRVLAIRIGRPARAGTHHHACRSHVAAGLAHRNAGDRSAVGTGDAARQSHAGVERDRDVVERFSVLDVQAGNLCSGVPRRTDDELCRSGRNVFQRECTVIAGE